MAHHSDRFSIRPSRYEQVGSKPTEFDLVGNGTIIALFGGAGYVIYDHIFDDGIRHASTVHADLKFWPILSNMSVGDIIAGLIIAVGIFFALGRFRFRWLTAAVAGVLAFWYLSSPGQLRAGLTIAHMRTTEFFSGTIFQAETTTPNSEFRLVNESPADQVYALPILEEHADIIEPVADKADQKIFEILNSASLATPADAPQRDLAKFGMVEMADGTVLARIRVGTNWLTADVRPDVAHSAFNRFDLIRIGQPGGDGDSTILSLIRLGVVRVEHVPIKILTQADGRNIVGNDLLKKLRSIPIGE